MNLLTQLAHHAINSRPSTVYLVRGMHFIVLVILFSLVVVLTDERARAVLYHALSSLYEVLESYMTYLAEHGTSAIFESIFPSEKGSTAATAAVATTTATKLSAAAAATTTTTTAPTPPPPRERLPSSSMQQRNNFLRELERSEQAETTQTLFFSPSPQTLSSSLNTTSSTQSSYRRRGYFTTPPDDDTEDVEKDVSKPLDDVYSWSTQSTPTSKSPSYNNPRQSPARRPPIFKISRNPKIDLGETSLAPHMQSLSEKYAAQRRKVEEQERELEKNIKKRSDLLKLEGKEKKDRLLKYEREDKEREIKKQEYIRAILEVLTSNELTPLYLERIRTDDGDLIRFARDLKETGDSNADAAKGLEWFNQLTAKFDECQALIAQIERMAEGLQQNGKWHKKNVAAIRVKLAEPLVKRLVAGNNASLKEVQNMVESYLKEHPPGPVEDLEKLPERFEPRIEAVKTDLSFAEMRGKQAEAVLKKSTKIAKLMRELSVCVVDEKLAREEKKRVFDEIFSLPIKGVIDIETAVPPIAEADKEQEVLRYAACTYGMFRELTLESWKKFGSRLFMEALKSSSPLCEPCICGPFGPPAGGATGAAPEAAQMHLVTLFGALAADQGDAPVSLADGWQWLIKMREKISRKVAKIEALAQDSPVPADDVRALRLGCKATHKFLVQAGAVMLQKYGGAFAGADESPWLTLRALMNRIEASRFPKGFEEVNGLREMLNNDAAKTLNTRLLANEKHHVLKALAIMADMEENRVMLDYFDPKAEIRRKEFMGVQAGDASQPFSSPEYPALAELKDTASRYGVGKLNFQSGLTRDPESWKSTHKIISKFFAHVSEGEEGKDPHRHVRKQTPYDEKRVDIVMVKVVKTFIECVKKEASYLFESSHESKAKICIWLCDPGGSERPSGILHKINPTNTAVFKDLLRAELYETFPIVIPRFGAAKSTANEQMNGLTFFSVCCLPKVGLFPLDEVWLWLASFANEIRSICQDDKSTRALYTVLSITWRALWENYEERFLDLLFVIKRDVFPYLVYPDDAVPWNVPWPWNLETRSVHGQDERHAWWLSQEAKGKPCLSNLLALLEALPCIRKPLPRVLPNLCAKCDSLPSQQRNDKCPDCPWVRSFFEEEVQLH